MPSSSEASRNIAGALARENLVFVENQLDTFRWSREIYDRLVSVRSRWSDEERQWLWLAHHQSTVLGVRRLLDQDDRSLSLAGLIRSVGRAGAKLSPARGEALPSSDEIEADLKQLEDVGSLIAQFANKFIAHRDRNDTETAVPDLSDIDHAIEEMERISARYRSLLTANAQG